MLDRQTIDSLWHRVEPCIRRLVPKMSETDRILTEVAVKRVLRHSLIPVDLSNLDYAVKYIVAGEPDALKITGHSCATGLIFRPARTPYIDPQLEITANHSAEF
jgi:hypothetical protein